MCKKPSKPIGQIEITSGGIIVKRTMPNRKPPTTYSRGKIDGFSKKSRQNLMKKLMRINLPLLATSLGNDTGQGFFITLTYPVDAPSELKTLKNHLACFRKRLRKHASVFWWYLETRISGKWKSSLSSALGI